MEQPDNPQLLHLELVARRALTHWGIEEAYTIELLKHRENSVYAVTRADGTKAAMRVHRLGYHSDAALRSELQWMKALRDGGVTTPEVIPTVDGDLLARVRIDELSEEYQCDLLSWVEGVPLGSAEERSFSGDEAVRRTYLATGRLAARMHNHSAAWPLPTGFERHSWDEDGCLGPGALWGLYGDLQDLTPGQLAHLDAGAAHTLRVLRAFGKASDRYGLIHSDFVPDNLLDTGTDIVVLDFDDCGFGWHLWEIATAVFWHLGGESYSVALGSFVDGYREYRPLPDEHLALLPVFLLLRGLVYLGWIHTRRETETAGQIFPFVLEETTRLCDALLGDMAQKQQDRPVREPIVSTGWESFFELTHVPAAVRVGDTLYVTGHTGDAPLGIYAADAEAQIRQTFVNVTQTLATAGFAWSDVVELTTYHVGLAKQSSALLSVAAEFLPEPYPAWTAVGVSELWDQEALVEISCVAVSQV